MNTPDHDPRSVTLAHSPTPNVEDTVNTKTVSRIDPSPVPPEIDSVAEVRLVF